MKGFYELLTLSETSCSHMHYYVNLPQFLSSTNIDTDSHRIYRYPTNLQESCINNES